MPCLPLQAEIHALRFLYEAMHSSSSGAPYPSFWQPQSSANTELLEVPLTSLEVQKLVWSVHRAGGTVVKVSVSGKYSWVGATGQVRSYELSNLPQLQTWTYIMFVEVV